MKPEIIIALDLKNKSKALEFLDKFDQELYVKVGMELFYSEGPDIIREIKARGHRIFLDLKLHDIPNTVKSAMKVIGKLGVDMTNVHAAGGRRMMSAALEGLTEGAYEAGRDERALLIAVTQLTSTDKELMNRELLIDGNVADVVRSYAKNAANSGLDGVVCSAWEVEDIHSIVDDKFITVTPGIRLAGDSSDDQSRIATPGKATEMGADYLVIGRSITGAPDPAAAYERCLSEMK